MSSYVEPSPDWVRSNTTWSRTFTDWYRIITSVDNFDTGGASAIDLSDPAAGYEYGWSGLITDQYMTDYDSLQYYGEPSFTVTSGNPAYDRFIHMTGLTAFRIDTAGLAAYVEQNGGAGFTYTVEVAFPAGAFTDADGTVNEPFEKVIAVRVPASAGTGAVPAALASTAAVSAPAALVPSFHPTALANALPPVARALAFASVAAGRLLAATAASKTFTVSAADVEALRGKAFDMPVRIDGNPSLWGILTDVGFDKGAFELVGTTAGTVFGGKRLTLQSDLTKDHFTLLSTQEALTGTSADGTVLTLRFKVRAEAKTKTYAIGVKALQAIDAKGAVKSAKAQNGSVRVGADAVKKTDLPGAGKPGASRPGTGSPSSTLAGTGFDSLSAFTTACLIALLGCALIALSRRRRTQHR
jgi:hypothetical protein